MSGLLWGLWHTGARRSCSQYTISAFVFIPEPTSTSKARVTIWKLEYGNNCAFLTAYINPLYLCQMGGRRLGRVFSDMWKRCTAAWGQLCLSAPERLVPHHTRTLLPRCEAGEHSALRGTALSHCVGCLGVEPGLEMFFPFLYHCDVHQKHMYKKCMASVYQILFWVRILLQNSLNGHQ